MTTVDQMRERDLLRQQKEYAKSDAMRLEIQKDYVLEDDNSGYIIFRKLKSETLILA